MEILIRAIRDTDSLGLLCLAESGADVAVARVLAAAHGLPPPHGAAPELLPRRLGTAGELRAAPLAAGGARAPRTAAERRAALLAARAAAK